MPYWSKGAKASNERKDMLFLLSFLLTQSERDIGNQINHTNFKKLIFIFLWEVACVCVIKKFKSISLSLFWFPQLTSLAEKLQAKEDTTNKPPGQVPEANPQQQLHPVNMNHIEPPIKTEDRLSSGSTVLDEDAPQLLDSCDSYFPNIAPIHHSEEHNNNGSVNDLSCFVDVFVPTTSPPHGHGESLGFWGWT